MAKKAKKRAPKKRVVRRPQSRLERERRLQRAVVWGAVALTVLVMGVIGYGLVREMVIEPRTPVALVGDVPVTMHEFQARVRFERMLASRQLLYLSSELQGLDPTDPANEFYRQYLQGQATQLQAQLSEENAGLFGEQIRDQLISEELVRQEADSRGITISADEVQREIETGFGYDSTPATPEPLPIGPLPVTPTEALTPTPTAEPLPTPTQMTAERFRQRYAEMLDSLKSLGIAERQYRAWVKASLASEALLEAMTAEIPAMAEQMELRTLIVGSEEQANQLFDRLEDGEEFQVLAEELEEDEEPLTHGGAPSWYPVDTLEERLGAELAGVALGLEAGEHSAPVPSEEGDRYTILEVMRRDLRELDEWERQQRGGDAFQQWLEQQQERVERLEYDPGIVPVEPS